MTPPEQLSAESQPRAFRPVPAIIRHVVDKPESQSPELVITPQENSKKTDTNAQFNRQQSEPVDTHRLQDTGSCSPGYINGGDSSRSLGGGRFLRETTNLTAGGSRASSQSPMRLSMPYISPGQLAFSALQYLPVPTIVLNSLKTVVLANESMGRLLGIVAEDGSEEDPLGTVDRLRGQTLSQVGIDMMQDGHPVWLTWEAFFNHLVGEFGVRAAASESQQKPVSANEARPPNATSATDTHAESKSGLQRDAVVEVVITRDKTRKAPSDNRHKPLAAPYQAFAKMIITIWEVEDKQMYFTLTFTSTRPTAPSAAATKKIVAKSGMLEAADRRTISNSNPASAASSRESSSPSFLSPGIVTMSSSPFPPMGPPTAASHVATTPSLLQKMTLMKDALLDNTLVPVVAMWKDGSATVPNEFARSLMADNADLDKAMDQSAILGSWEVWDENFSRRLATEEYPLSILIRTEAPFATLRIGMYNTDGKRIIYDVVGEAIRDEATGEFLAGVVTGRDVTVMTEKISEIKEQDEERFRLICDTMPQLVWTCTPDGLYDFLNSRWFEYTGFKPEQCLGKGLESLVHPDDMPETLARWQKSLHNGEPFKAEYRCRGGKDGEWRWYLGQALAVRNKESGEIVKWFGTCTDVHESTAAKHSAQRTREQLLSVIAHSHVTIFTVDPDRRVTMLEGALIWDNNSAGGRYEDRRWFIGESMYTVFNRLTAQLPDGETPEWLEPIEDVIEGRVAEDQREHGLDDRWYRTRFFPMHGTRMQESKPTGETCIEGAIGVIMDVTELRTRQEALQKQLHAKRQAEANAKAAKDATRLKSQFLANMSHEIRTPISGVIGMAELLAGMELDDEQREYVVNIQSSAMSLLTVINDILDFSKVESGRLEVEEVQFSLSVVLRDVGKMLQFAAERKSLSFQLDIGGDIEDDMVVMGDPGRVRQIILNLLMNSIKFTNQGHVRFSATKVKETADSVEVKFMVEDTGIGMHEDVRKKLFQPFSQGDTSTARKHGGTGLGLTISKSLLDLMHGRINLESTSGIGTVVSFWIPFNKPQAGQKLNLAHVGAIPDRLQSELSLSCNSSEYDQMANSPVTDAGSHLGSTSHLRRHSSIRTPPNIEHDLPSHERANMLILIVEDNDVNQMIAKKTIARLGFKTCAVWNGKEALSYLLKTRTGETAKPDIILMDVQMPVIDGYRCTHVLRHHMPYKQIVQDVPIVAMTASAIQGDKEKCVKAGMDDYLSKPVQTTMLEKKLILWGISRQNGFTNPGSTAYECSEVGEDCDNADIPGLEVDDTQMSQLGEGPDEYQNMITPRPLTADGKGEPSPFVYDKATSELAPQVRRLEGDNEMSNRLQETKLIDAAGGLAAFRSSSIPETLTFDQLTEENINKLRDEKRITDPEDVRTSMRSDKPDRGGSPI